MIQIDMDFSDRQNRCGFLYVWDYSLGSDGGAQFGPPRPGPAQRQSGWAAALDDLDRGALPDTSLQRDPDVQFSLL